MKRKIWILTTALLLISVATYFYFRSDSKTNVFDARSARKSIKKGEIWLVRVGPDIDIDKIDFISRKYGFRIAQLGKVTYGEQWRNDVKEYNKVIYEWLEKRNGKGWVQKYDAEVAQFIARASKNNTMEDIKTISSEN